VIVLMKILEKGHQIYSPEQYKKTKLFTGREDGHLTAWKVKPLGEVEYLPEVKSERDRLRSKA
jgi:hypothetical protein